MMKDVVDGLGSGMFLNSLTQPQCLDCFGKEQKLVCSYPCAMQSLHLSRQLF